MLFNLRSAPIVPRLFHSIMHVTATFSMKAERFGVIIKVTVDLNSAGPCSELVITMPFITSLESVPRTVVKVDPRN